MDIVGIKLLKKLADVISKGVGTATKPYFIRRNADAVAYEMRTLADAKAYEIEKITDALFDSRSKTGHAEFKSDELALLTPADVSAEKLSLPERAQSRESYQSQLEQENTEQVTRYATEQILQAEEVSEEPVDDDWIKRFFGHAKDVSTDQMQMLWGKILAGEVVKPGSFSLRTLDSVRNLSQEEARIFTKVCKYTVHSSPKNLMFFYDAHSEFFDKEVGINYEDTLLLEEAGLLTPYVGFNATLHDEPPHFLMIYKNNILRFEFPEGEGQTMRYNNIRKLTRVGSEIYKLIDEQIDDTYIYRLASKLKGSAGYLYIGQLVLFEMNKLQYGNLVLVEQKILDSYKE